MSGIPGPLSRARMLTPVRPSSVTSVMVSSPRWANLTMLRAISEMAVAEAGLEHSLPRSPSHRERRGGGPVGPPQPHSQRRDREAERCPELRLGGEDPDCAADHYHGSCNGRKHPSAQAAEAEQDPAEREEREAGEVPDL